MKRSQLTSAVKIMSLMVAVLMMSLPGCSAPGEGQGLIPCVSCAPAAKAAPAPAPKPAPIVQAPDVVCGRLVWPTGNMAT
ncbi:MAG: hypothetical protein ACF8OB_13375, partial [Phycisphaeraceae bacterium JB051]